MPRVSPATNDALTAIVAEIGKRMGEALIEGIQSAMSARSVGPTAVVAVKRGPGRPPKAASLPAPAPSSSAPARRGPGRPPKANPSPCLVPGCGRKTVAKGLCQGHYRKAGRMNLMGKTDKASLAKLAADGRATRWAKKKS